MAARVCLASSTMVALCGCHRGSLEVTCNDNGKPYPANSTISDDPCGTCVCTADGHVRCTAHACPISLDASTQDDAGQDDAGQSFDATTDKGTDGFGADAGHDTRGGYGDMCWSNSDCVQAPFTPPPQPYCEAPDGTATVSYGCPVCFTPPTTCAADGDCAGQGPAWICAVPSCSCNSIKTCEPGCTKDGDCAAGQSCGTDHRCAASACGAGAPACPTDFVCGASQTCQRRPCSSDAECSGACVIGKCFDRPGRCTDPPV